MHRVLEKLFSYNEQEWHVVGLQAKHGCHWQSIAGLIGTVVVGVIRLTTIS